MKFIKILTLVLGFSLVGISNSYAFWWTPQERDCKATLTTTLSTGDEGVEVTFKEEWEGTKSVCKDGDWFCIASDCG